MMAILTSVRLYLIVVLVCISLIMSVERSDRMWSTGEGNGKPLQYSCLENPMNSMKRQDDRILKEELPRSVGAQIATGDQWRNNSRMNEGMEPKQKQYPAVDVTGDRSKVRCCKEQYCIGTWNVTLDLPEITGTSRGNQGFPAPTRKRPRESFFNAS